MKIIFAGTPEFAAKHLKALLTTKHEIILVLTQPDRPAGRGRHLQTSAVKKLAKEYHLPLVQVAKLNTQNAENLNKLNADLMIVVAYGLILPQYILDIPKYGCINIHASLLPKWRGAAPVQRAIMNNDHTTGITIMKMDAGLDTGDILQQTQIDINNQDTTNSLLNKLAQIGAYELLQFLNKYPNITAIKQNNNLATLAKKIIKDEAIINWHNTATYIDCQIRALQTWPVAKFKLHNEFIKVLQASVINNNFTKKIAKIVAIDDGINVQTSDGIIKLIKLQLNNKKAMTTQQILNGNKNLFYVGQLLNLEN